MARDLRGDRGGDHRSNPIADSARRQAGRDLVSHTPDRLQRLRALLRLRFAW